MESYFLVCYQFRNTLTHLSICYHDERSKKYDNLFIERLQHFQCLTHLSFSHTFDNLTLFGNCMSQKPAQFQICQQSSYLVEKAETELQQIIDNPPLFERLQVLDINVPLFSTPYIKYITNHPSDTLTSSSVCIGQVEFSSWIKTNSMEKGLALTNRMSSLKEARLYNELGSSHQVDEAERNNSSTIMTKEHNADHLYRILKSICGDRQLIGTMHYLVDSVMDIIEVKATHNPARIGKYDICIENNQMDTIVEVINLKCIEETSTLQHHPQ